MQANTHTFSVVFAGIFVDSGTAGVGLNKCCDIVNFVVNNKEAVFGLVVLCDLFPSPLL